MPGSPTVRRRQLGMELARLRKAAAKNQKDAARWLDLKADTSISKIENGKQNVTVPQLRSLLQLYGVGEPHQSYLVQLCKEASQRGWWVEYGKTVPDWFGDYVGMETAAAEVWTWEQAFVPGLLQTPDYTRAINLPVGHPEAEVQRIVQLRADRQNRLTDEEPLILRAVIDEAVLRRKVGGPEVMRDQLRHLLDRATLPNVTVQVLPFSAGAHRGMPGSFAALRFPEEAMNTAYLEAYKTAAYAEAPDEVAFYVGTFEDLAAQALSGDDTARLINAVMGSET